MLTEIIQYCNPIGSPLMKKSVGGKTAAIALAFFAAAAFIATYNCTKNLTNCVIIPPLQLASILLVYFATIRQSPLIYAATAVAFGLTTIGSFAVIKAEKEVKKEIPKDYWQGNQFMQNSALIRIKLFFHAFIGFQASYREVLRYGLNIPHGGARAAEMPEREISCFQAIKDALIAFPKLVDTMDQASERMGTVSGQMPNPDRFDRMLASFEPATQLLQAMQGGQGLTRPGQQAIQFGPTATDDPPRVTVLTLEEARQAGLLRPRSHQDDSLEETQPPEGGTVTTLTEGEARGNQDAPDQIDGMPVEGLD